MAGEHPLQGSDIPYPHHNAQIDQEAWNVIWSSNSYLVKVAERPGGLEVTLDGKRIGIYLQEQNFYSYSTQTRKSDVTACRNRIPIVTVPKPGKVM